MSSLALTASVFLCTTTASNGWVRSTYWASSTVNCHSKQFRLSINLMATLSKMETPGNPGWEVRMLWGTPLTASVYQLLVQLDVQGLIPFEDKTPFYCFLNDKLCLTDQVHGSLLPAGPLIELRLTFGLGLTFWPLAHLEISCLLFNARAIFSKKSKLFFF